MKPGLIQTPPPPQPLSVDTDAAGAARSGLWLLLAGLGGFLLWSVLAPLDQGIVGSGTVVVSGERKTVQTLLGGVVEEIRVREGDLVTQGQVLVRLNTVQTQSQLDITVGQWLSARALEARLLAERLDRKQIDWPRDLLARRKDPRAREAMELQGNLFATRRAELASRLQIMAREEAAQSEELAGYVEIRRHHEDRLDSQRQELETLRELAAQGYVPRISLLEKERASSAIHAELASTISAIGRVQQALNESQLKVDQQLHTFRSEVEAQLTQVSAEVSSLNDRIRALAFEVKNGAVIAPAAGQVMGMNLHTVGGIAQPGQRLMDIVPQGASWIVKAKFPPMVADRLNPGLAVDVRFSSLQQIRTPVLEGRVVTVSPDQLLDEKSGQPYFAAEVAVDPASLADISSAGLEVKPGMEVGVLVKTGERTLADYLIKPISNSLAGALKEE